jgi:hypothetical protein
LWQVRVMSVQHVITALICLPAILGAVLLVVSGRREVKRRREAWLVGRVRCRDRHDGALVPADFGEVTMSGAFICNVCLGRADYYPPGSEDLPENGLCGRCHRELPVTALEGVTLPERRVCKTRCLLEIKREALSGGAIFPKGES